jgi:hypothetical protein
MMAQERISDQIIGSEPQLNDSAWIAADVEVVVPGTGVTRRFSYSQLSKALNEKGDLADRLEKDLTELRTAAETEVARAKGAESTLTDVVVKETARAQDAEQANTDAISAETTRAQGAEQANTDAISTETTQAQGAEQANTDAISAETTRASSRENEIGTELTQEAARAMADEAGLAEKITAETTRAQGAEQTNTDAISAEVERAKDAEQTLSNLMGNEATIAAETTRAQKAEADLQAALTAETTRAQGAEQTNTDAIATETQERQTADTTEMNTRAQTDTALQNSLNTETTRAKSAESTLSDVVVKETARAQKAETILASAISAEATRAQGAEQANTDAISAETARAMADEAGLAEKITAEAARAQAAEQAAQATADEAKAIAESAIHLRGVLMFGADTVASMQGIPEARISEGDACGVQETNLTYQWDGDQKEWIEQPHGEDAVGDQWNMNSWYGVWQNQTFSGNATASIVCVTTEPLYWALTVSESTGVGGDLGINGDHIDISSQTVPSEITEDAEKFVGGFAAKFSGFFQAAISKINGLFSLVAEKLNIADVQMGYTPQGTLLIDGVTGETRQNNAEEISIYTHHIKVKLMNGTTFVLYLSTELTTNNAEPFTTETFWQLLANYGFISEATSKPIKGRYTTGNDSSLDVGAIWINEAQTQIMVTTIASNGTATQTIPLAGKTTTVDDFVKEALFSIARHTHGFRIEDMSGGFIGTFTPKVLQAK